MQLAVFHFMSGLSVKALEEASFLPIAKHTGTQLIHDQLHSSGHL